VRQRVADEGPHLRRLLPPAGVVKVEPRNVGEKLVNTRFNLLAWMCASASEPGLPPLAPAFANAIARLTGKPLRQLPFKLA
jgi:hypothetical protein